MKSKIIWILLLLGSGAFVFFGEGVSLGVEEALKLCFKVIIPGLFPFMVMSRLMIKCGGTELFCQKGMSRAVFPFLAGIFSGYPVGAAITAQMVKKGDISADEGGRIIGFCNNPGPAFVMVSVAAMTGCTRAGGVLLWVSQVLAAATVGAITGIGKRKEKGVKVVTNQNERFISAAVDSVKSGTESIIIVCGFVVFFAALLAVLHRMGVYSFMAGVMGMNETIAQAIIGGLIETTSGIAALGKTAIPIHLKLLFTSVLLGWSGLSVHMQVIAVTMGSGIKLKGYFKGKLMQTFIAPFWTLVLMRFVPITVQTSVWAEDIAVKLFAWTFIFTLFLCADILIILSTFSGNRLSAKK